MRTGKILTERIQIRVSKETLKKLKARAIAEKRTLSDTTRLLMELICQVIPEDYIPNKIEWMRKQ